VIFWTNGGPSLRLVTGIHDSGSSFL
jgi:hypothetical protein